MYSHAKLGDNRIRTRAQATAGPRHHAVVLCMPFDPKLSTTYLSRHSYQLVMEYTFNPIEAPAFSRTGVTAPVDPAHAAT